jgi:hypothetical protein
MNLCYGEQGDNAIGKSGREGKERERQMNTE